MEVTPSAVMRQVDRIVGSNSFRNAERLRAFLRFVVQEALAGRQNEIKEYSIGREVCGRPTSFDPKADPIVRVDANRLRSRLQTYYQTEGVSDEVVVELPKGSYIPVFKWTTPSEATQPGPSSLAVLPFVNLSGTNEHDYFADSLTEELIHALARLDGLHVIARSSVFQFKGRTDDGCVLGKRLRVDHVLEGSVLLAGNRLRVTAQLIDVRHGWVLWSEKYESDWKNIFTVQDELTGSITDALKIRLNAKAAPELFTHATEDADAYADYLRGRYYWNQRTPAALSASIRFYERALERDPKCAPAYAGIADTLSVMALNDQEPTLAVTPRARATAHKALELRPGWPEALTSLGFVKCILDWDWEGGARDFEEAIRRQPGYSTAHYLYGIASLTPRGLWPEALAAVRAALRLDPVSPVLLRDLGMIHFMRRDFHEAKAAWRQAEELAPAFHGCLYWRARVAIEEGEFDHATAALEARMAAGPSNTRVLATMAYAWARQGSPDKANAILKELTSRACKSRVPPLDFATIWLGLGESGKALDSLEKACEERAATLYQFAVDPIYDSIRAEPRAQALRLAMGLPQVTLR